MRRNESRIALALLLAAASLGQGCASATASVSVVDVPQALESPSRFRKEYVLAPDDQIEVVVQRVPEVSRAVVIRPDGFISLPILTDVQAAGLTPRELGAKLTELFAARLNKPEVAVIATKVRPAMVYVTGEVTASVAVPLRDAPTAMQAVAFAGGIKKSGAGDRITIIRLGEDGRLHAIPVARPSEGQPGPYMGLRLARLQADDLVFVPESGRSQVSRGIEDFITRPLSGPNSMLQFWANFRLIEELNRPY